MQLITASLSLIVASVVAIPTIDGRPLEAREPEALPGSFTSQRRGSCNVPENPDSNVLCTLLDVCQKRGCTAEQTLATFETGLVESNCNNISCGDQDSVGVFQQRLSMDWGTYNECMNVTHATNAFLDALFKCSNENPGDAPGSWAQCAQLSERPDAYNEMEPRAREVLNGALASCGGGSNGGGSGGDSGAANVETSSGGSSGGSGSSGGTTSSSTCAKWHKVVKGDSCMKIEKKFHISSSKLHSLNPNINKHCSNLKVGKSVCVKKGSSASISKLISDSSESSGSSHSLCKSKKKAKKGDTCKSIAKAHKISVGKFLSLNPKVNKHCTNLVAGESYCV